MPTPVSVARQCLTTDAAHALDEAVSVARKRVHAQTTSLHAVSALLSLPTSILRNACARVRNSAYSPRLQFRALELCLSVSLDRIQSGHSASGRSDDPPVSNSLMAAIKRSQAHQRRLPENFRLYHEMSQQQNQNTLSCVKVELRQLILSILDDPVVSRVFGEAGFRSSELKLSIIRPIPHVLRYPRTRGLPLFLCNIAENSDHGSESSGLYPTRRGLNVPYRSLDGVSDEDANHRRIGAIFAREKGRNPLLIGVSANSVLTDFLHSLEKRTDGTLPTGLNGLNAINIGNDITDQISGRFDKVYVRTRFHELSKLVEQSSGPGIVVNCGDLRVFTDNGGSASSADYIVGQVSELLQRHGRRVWLSGSASGDEVYYKFVRRFHGVEKDWDLQLLTITSHRPCLVDKSYSKSSLMGSFIPFGGFFSSPSELKLPFSGHAQNQNQKDVSGLPNTRPVYQSTLPPWLQMNTGIDLNQEFNSKTKEGFDSVGSGSNVLSSAASDKSVTTDLNLRICAVSARDEIKNHVNDKDFSQSQSSSPPCLDHHLRDISTDNFKSIFRILTKRVSWQGEAARIISCTISQQQKIGTRRDIWLNLVGHDAMGKHRMMLAVAEVVYQSEQRFINFDLGSSLEMDGCDDTTWVRGQTMVDRIFEGLCKNPFCVVFLENAEKADDQIQTSLSMAIQSGKFRDSHGREVSIGNTTFVMASPLEYSGITDRCICYSEEKIVGAKGRTVEISIEIASKLPYKASSMNKRKLIGSDKTLEESEITETVKRSHRGTTTGSLDLNVPPEEIEIHEMDRSKENSKIWLKNFTNHTRMVNVPFKPFDFDGLAERIERDIRKIFNKCVNSDCLVEIGPRIMETFLATVYYSDNEDIYNEMMEKVIRRVSMEVRERYDIASTSVVRLVDRDRVAVPEDQAHKREIE